MISLDYAFLCSDHYHLLKIKVLVPVAGDRWHHGWAHRSVSQEIQMNPCWPPGEPT